MALLTRRRRAAWCVGLLAGAALIAPPAHAQPEDDDAPAPEVEPASPSPRAAPRQSFVEAIELIGNRKTEDAVILRQVLVPVNGVVNDDLLDESRLRLLASGYFKSVDFSLRRGSERGRVILVIEVVERNTLTLDGLILGFSDLVPFFAGAGVAESNFLGKGMSLSLHGVAGKDRRAAELSLFLPDVSSTGLQLGLTLRRVDGVELLSDTDPEKRTLSYARTGGQVGLGLRFGAGQASLGYRLESVVAPRLASLDPALLRQAPSVQFDQSVISALSLTYLRDTRDDVLVPLKGGRLELAVELSSRVLASSYEYSKYTAELELAFNPFAQHGLELHAFAGLIQGRAPFFSQFFVRDFSHFSLGTQALPRILGLNFSSFNDYDDLVFDLGAQYAVPIASGTQGVYRAYLYAGVDLAVTASLDELQQDSTGRGLGGRFPVSLDVGIKLDTFLGHFSISAAYVLDLVL